MCSCVWDMTRAKSNLETKYGWSENKHSTCHNQIPRKIVMKYVSTQSEMGAPQIMALGQTIQLLVHLYFNELSMCVVRLRQFKFFWFYSCLFLVLVLAPLLLLLLWLKKPFWNTIDRKHEQNVETPKHQYAQCAHKQTNTQTTNKQTNGIQIEFPEDVFTNIKFVSDLASPFTVKIEWQQHTNDYSIMPKLRHAKLYAQRTRRLTKTSFQLNLAIDELAQYFVNVCIELKTRSGKLALTVWRH